MVGLKRCLATAAALLLYTTSDVQSTEPSCSGRYADSDVIMSEAIENYKPIRSAVYCLRNTTVIEKPYYTKERKLVKSYERSIIHGTGLAFKHNDKAYILTNFHIANPDIPLGSRAISEKLEIVDSINDEFEKDNIELSFVRGSQAYDIAVLKPKGQIRALDVELGSAEELEPGDFLVLEGYPFGITQTTIYTSVNTQDHIDYAPYYGWDHHDFVINPNTDPGHSGSPVFAINCATRKPEYVGIYHSSYTGAKGLRLVIKVDQFKEIFSTLKLGKKEPKSFLYKDITKQRFAKLNDYLSNASTNERIFIFGETAIVLEQAKRERLVVIIPDELYPYNQIPKAKLIGTTTLDKVLGKYGNETRPNKELCTLYKAILNYVFEIINYRELVQQGFQDRTASERANNFYKKLIEKNLIEEEENLLTIIENID